MHVPEPRLHTVRSMGADSSVSRGRRRKALDEAGISASPTATTRHENTPSAAERRRLRRQWAQMIRRIYEADPLLCDCGGQMRVISFITDPPVVQKILAHLASKDLSRGRDPPSVADAHRLAY